MTYMYGIKPVKCPLMRPSVRCQYFQNPKGVFIATQLNSTELAQLNSVQPISKKQVSHVFVYDVINGPLT